jgi:hypothetical protein
MNSGKPLSAPALLIDIFWSSETSQCGGMWGSMWGEVLTLCQAKLKGIADVKLKTDIRPGENPPVNRYITKISTSN